MKQKHFLLSRPEYIGIMDGYPMSWGDIRDKVAEFYEGAYLLYDGIVDGRDLSYFPRHPVFCNTTWKRNEIALNYSEQVKQIVKLVYHVF